MPNLYCTLPDNDFHSYGIILEVIASCTTRSVKEKDIRGNVIIHVAFYSIEDKELFLKKMGETLLKIPWRERI
ncbi:MAG: hypothetical protein QM726_08450 [Chitinophagaceae bacterium]